MKKVLLINAHQFYKGFAEGELNKTMIGLMREVMEAKGYEVKLTAIEKGYDIDEELEKHLWADLIITQSPVYWFGTPWIHKKYIDEVFTAGLGQKTLVADDGRTRSDPEKQYGTGGSMQGNKFMLSLTWNAPAEAFDDKNQSLFEGNTVDDQFVAITSAYKFCGFEILPSFSCFDVRKNPDIEMDIRRLNQHLSRIS
ncbi:MAG: flavodoxin family protein [Gammaproteobacteria bacterium]|nr:flavodoxin family protein [Gammaproteobacteria bacterium]